MPIHFFANPFKKLLLPSTGYLGPLAATNALLRTLCPPCLAIVWHVTVQHVAIRGSIGLFDSTASLQSGVGFLQVERQNGASHASVGA
jgi:hypothetical protein